MFSKSVLIIFSIGHCFFLIGQKNWESLPFKVDGGPYFFYSDTFSGSLIVGGYFKHVDNKDAGIVLLKDNKATPADDSFLTWPSNCCIRYDSTIFIGSFNGLHKFSNGKWTKIDTNGNSNVVLSFEVYNKYLLVGGAFDKFNYPDKQYGAIVYWDGSRLRAFKGIDTILDAAVHSISCLKEYKGELYAGGNINNFKGFKEILRWNGFNWNNVSGGISGSGDNWINDMEVYKGELYVAGRFLKSSGAVDNHIVRWDGQNWKEVGGGVKGQAINDIEVFEGELWVAGIFDSAGGVFANNIAKWNGNKWCGFGDNFDNPIGCMGVYKDELYVGGAFNVLNNKDSISYVSKWIGNHYNDTCGVINYSNVPQSSIINNFQIFPNPFNGEFYVLMKEDFSKQYNLEIYDMLGNKIQTYELDSTGVNVIDCKEVIAGVYVYRVRDIDKDVYMGKLIKY